MTMTRGGDHPEDLTRGDVDAALRYMTESRAKLEPGTELWCKLSRQIDHLLDLFTECRG